MLLARYLRSHLSRGLSRARGRGGGFNRAVGLDCVVVGSLGLRHECVAHLFLELLHLSQLLQQRRRLEPCGLHRNATLAQLERQLVELAGRHRVSTLDTLGEHVQPPRLSIFWRDGFELLGVTFVHYLCPEEPLGRGADRERLAVVHEPVEKDDTTARLRPHTVGHGGIRRGEAALFVHVDLLVVINKARAATGTFGQLVEIPVDCEKRSLS
mmetsp:Transcript_50018/g.99636  ORF Transcript_50018/g.99636 Transcript_50018/m.99636 type:complete len:212 (-) Transcript_50018:511-1146(-)